MDRKHNAFSAPRISLNPSLEHSDRQQLKYPQATLSASQRAAVEKAVRGVCHFRRYLLRALNEIIKDGKTEWKNSPPPSPDEMLEKFESWSNELIDRASQLNDADWERKPEFYYQGKLMRNDPIGPFLWAMLFDEIHHRGQLMAYLRPMGGKVPAIYGPSADAQPKTMAIGG